MLGQLAAAPPLGLAMTILVALLDGHDQRTGRAGMDNTGIAEFVDDDGACRVLTGAPRTQGRGRSVSRPRVRPLGLPAPSPPGLGRQRH